MLTTAPYGSWLSPITSDVLVDRVVDLGQVQVIDRTVYWNEGRPAEAGRQVVVRREADGSISDVVPAGFSARTLVHEYGGQSFAVSGATVPGVLFFSNFTDQRLYRLDLDEAGRDPVAITPESPTPGAWRYADPVVTPDGQWVICVRERHADDVVNDVVAVPADGGGEPLVLAEDHDFFSAPRISPDGASVCWLSWDHPNMPWDGTELWSAPFADGRLTGPATWVAGGPEESISQPRWSPGGTLHYVSDRSGWWNIYAEGSGCLAELEAEFTGPDWAFGQSTYGFSDDGSVVAAWAEDGTNRFGVIDDGKATEIPLLYTDIAWLQPLAGGRMVAVAGSPSQARVIVTIDVHRGKTWVLKLSRPAPIASANFSLPDPVEFPTEDGLTAHALFYPPHNRDFEAPPGEKPPLIVTSHGGPTSAASSVLNLGVQFLTSRGFAVIDVNYGGSTGYGRDYRERLRGRWGIVDVDDCANAARYLAAAGLVDPERMVIRGGSAGGYTTLAALTFRDVFAAGASKYGVADAAALAKDTHKFESRYLDGLIGPYPEAKELYEERSPIHHTDRLDRPMILFQGLEDKVVPPAQSEMMVAALRAKGVPVAYLAFDGEQHGFRQAENIKRAADAELSFYGQVLGFEPAGDIEKVTVENLEGWGRTGSNRRASD